MLLYTLRHKRFLVSFELVDIFFQNRLLLSSLYLQHCPLVVAIDEQAGNNLIILGPNRNTLVRLADHQARVEDADEQLFIRSTSI